MPATPPAATEAAQQSTSYKDMSTISLQQDLENGDFYSVLTSSLARILLGHDNDGALEGITWQSCGENWNNFISEQASHLLNHLNQESVPALRANLFSIGVAALNAFLQSNVTGPPLSWATSDVLLPTVLYENPDQLKNIRRLLILSLSVDGETAYHLTPRVELFCLAKCLLNHGMIIGEEPSYVWGRLRVNSWHQRMLNENVHVLQRSIYHDLEIVERSISPQDSRTKAQFLVERATIHTHHGLETKAREDLKTAAEETGLEFALTGRLGKRTKFQQFELSQLVVLAKSVQSQGPLDQGVNHTSRNESVEKASKPMNLDLNDDTLLEAIAFSKDSSTSSTITDEEKLPSSLKSLDPTHQPTLHPLDSIILLATASLITNTSPQDGLTREETLPYAIRVLTGSSTNWQIYTQALLVRSRMEGFRSRTVERGVLQLQAVVDQVIADTTPEFSPPASDPIIVIEEPVSTSFLPKPKASESAPVSERLLYIHQLASPTRWKLEAELADRWVSLGGLRTALEIYERLQMWAEVALCWAASNREDEARKIIRNQLYENSSVKPHELAERVPLPADAPRLFCILGDMDRSPAAYERAWEVSNNRFARAQRSLGRHYLSIHNLPKADEAYVKSLRISPQNHSSWFALGSVRLQREDWIGAVDAFGRAIQIEEQDAESWSNLAAALVRLPPDEASETLSTSKQQSETSTDEIETESSTPNPQKHTQEAFVALKRAAVLKRDSYRIWQNLLAVAVKLSPPPYTDLVIAQTRLIDLLGHIEGEKCIDLPILQALVGHLIATTPSPPPSSSSSLPPSSSSPSSKRGFPTMLLTLLRTKIHPLITHSRPLWLLSAKLSLHLSHPRAALNAYEKAWRLALARPGWEVPGTPEAQDAWDEVADATGELVDAYAGLGDRVAEREDAEERIGAEGGACKGVEGEGEGELVCDKWKFKSRSALRAVLGRAREGWADSGGYGALEARLEELK